MYPGESGGENAQGSWSDESSEMQRRRLLYRRGQLIYTVAKSVHETGGRLVNGDGEPSGAAGKLAAAEAQQSEGKAASASGEGTH